MKEFIIRRVLQTIPVLIGLSILIFVLTRIIPGDAVRLALGPQATDDQIAAMRETLGLDHNLFMQYVNYMAGLFQGDWGYSLRTQRNVFTDIVQTFPATLELTTVAMIMAVLLGVPLGVISALKKDKWTDQFTRIFGLTGVAMPRFWLGIMLQIMFAYWLSLFPIIGRGDIIPATITGLRLFDSLITLNFPAFIDSLRHIFLPALALSVGALAQIMRLTRANMLEQVNKDYILASKSYGLPGSTIVYKYMLKNAFTSTLTIIGLSYGFLIGNAFLVEAVFSWPGMAQYGIQSVIYRDFNAIVGITLVIGIVFAIANLVVDLLYSYLDPRIKYQ